MNFRLRQERNAFVLLVLVAFPLLVLTAPLPFLTKLQAPAPLAGDLNGDGYLDASEAAKLRLAPVFEIYDANGDGRLDRVELARVRTVQPRLMEARL